MLYNFRRMPVSRFREEAGRAMDWVEADGGMIWLTRHGKHVAALIPFYQLKVLEEVLGRTETQKADMLEAEYKRFRAAKAVQAAEERARLAAGQQVGGSQMTRTMEQSLERGDDPWEDDPVLITTKRGKWR